MSRRSGGSTWKNGAVAEMFSADETEGLRGPQFSAAWCDEFAKWRNAEAAWDMLQFALRLGDHPQVVVTTTPRATRIFEKDHERRGDGYRAAFNRR